MDCIHTHPHTHAYVTVGTRRGTIRGDVQMADMGSPFPYDTAGERASVVRDVPPATRPLRDKLIVLLV